MLDELLKALAANPALNLAVGGIGAIPFIFIVVQALKTVGLVKPGKEPAANIYTSIAFGILYGAITLFPQVKDVAQVVFISFVGALGSAVLYNRTLGNTNDKA